MRPEMWAGPGQKASCPQKGPPLRAEALGPTEASDPRWGLQFPRRTVEGSWGWAGLSAILSGARTPEGSRFPAQAIRSHSCRSAWGWPGARVALGKRQAVVCRQLCAQVGETLPLTTSYLTPTSSQVWGPEACTGPLAGHGGHTQPGLGWGASWRAALPEACCFSGGLSPPLALPPSCPLAPALSPLRPPPPRGLRGPGPRWSCPSRTRTLPSSSAPARWVTLGRPLALSGPVTSSESGAAGSALDGAGCADSHGRLRRGAGARRSRR